MKIFQSDLDSSEEKVSSRSDGNLVTTPSPCKNDRDARNVNLANFMETTAEATSSEKKLRLNEIENDQPFFQLVRPKSSNIIRRNLKKITTKQDLLKPDVRAVKFNKKLKGYMCKRKVQLQ